MRQFSAKHRGCATSVDERDRGARSDALPAWLWAALFGLAPLAGGLGALVLGKDFSWDFRNYHYYNAHAFLVGRSGIDIAPAQLQSFYNPVLDLPMYALVRTLPAPLVGFSLGAVQALNFSLVFLLFRRVSRIASAPGKWLAAAAVSLIACIAPATLIELGTGTGDNLVSLLVLAGLLAAVSGLERSASGEVRLSRRSVLLAGFAMGAAVGLKQTTIAFALGSALALLCVARPRREAFSAVTWFGLAGLSGVLLLSGHWMWAMWLDFANPFFPYFNHVFRSTAIAPAAFVNERFLPRELWEYFVWPLVFSLDSGRVSYYHFTDVRFAVLYVTLLAGAVRLMWRRMIFRSQATQSDLESRGEASTREWFDRDGSSLLLAFLVFSFIVWMLLFSLYRYLLPLELLVPLCFLILLDRFDLRRWSVRAVGVAAAIAVLACFSVKIPERTPWTSRYLAVDRSRFDPPPGSLMVMLGWHPMAYVIPELPADLAYVRPGGNLRLTPRHGLHREMVRRVRDAKGAVYVMYGGSDRPAEMLTWARSIGLTYDPTRCARLLIDPPDNIRVCRADRWDG